MNSYDDIIILKRPISQRHRMSIRHRAKIFAPFSALKGFEQALEREERLLVSPDGCSEDSEDVHCEC